MSVTYIKRSEIMLFKKERDPERICKRCRYARIIDDDENVLCTYKGVIDAESSCKRFTYDYLKREPAKHIKPDSLEFIDINE